jgi:hypothetical protein
MILVDVVKVIFNNNPTEISSIYSSQVAIYSKNLLERNKQCFTEKKGIYYFAKDTLRQIPYQLTKNNYDSTILHMYYFFHLFEL